MMNINELVLTDEALALVDNGTWVGDLDCAPGVELLVCGFQSQEARKALEKKQALARTKNRNKPLSADQLARCTQEVLAEVVLKGWKGLSDGKKEIAYSKELATKWLTSRNGEKFAGLVLQAAHKLDDQANDFAADVTKN